MNISISLKDILIFFTKLSFKIAFFIGTIIYKIYFLDKSNNTLTVIVNIILTISIVFLVEDLIEKIIKFIQKKVTIKKYKKEIQQLSDPQIAILVSNYLDLKNNRIVINPTAYFSIEEGEYQILLSKLIIFRASTVQASFNFPFTLQEWAYNELDEAIQSKKITYNKKGKENIVNWYGKEVKFQEKESYDYYNI